MFKPNYIIKDSEDENIFFEDINEYDKYVDEIDNIKS